MLYSPPRTSRQQQQQQQQIQYLQQSLTSTAPKNTEQNLNPALQPHPKLKAPHPKLLNRQIQSPFRHLGPRLHPTSP